MQPKTWRWILGMLYVIAVAVIWILASFLVQSVVSEGVSPFLIAYVCNTLFIVYIPIVELGNLTKSWVASVRSKRAATDTLPSGPTESVQGSETQILLKDGPGSDLHSQVHVDNKVEAFHASPLDRDR
ncbi:hypothetical protein KP509_34G040600 [Ceratopteris richardii]|uniref:Uncharacterized protein n=1 Tax=Ceratopteris richardii TaxID=49495 RepID=A0A8T2QJ73_CERRI|nr:hypothetical protein KP509_34G040600 [Ceratopteris richardii]